MCQRRLRKLYRKNDDEIKHRLDDFINESSVRNEQVRKDLMGCVSKIEQSIDKMHEDNLSHWETSKTARSNIDNRFQRMIDLYINRIFRNNKKCFSLTLHTVLQIRNQINQYTHHGLGI